MNNTRTISIMVIAGLVIALGLFLWMKFPQGTAPKSPVSEFTNKVHSDLFATADATWDSTFSAGILRPTLINEQEIGSATGIRLEWTPPTQSYNHFLVTVTQPDTGWKRSESREHDALSLDVADLLPDTKYVFALRACLDPKCETWVITDDEVTSRTGKMILQETREEVNPESPTIETRDSLGEIKKETILFLHEDGSPFSVEEKDALSLGAVLIDNTSNHVYVQTSVDKKLRLMRFLNP